MLIVTHGLTIRCFVMHFLYLTVAQFGVMDNAANCEIITLGPKGTIPQPLFRAGAWAVGGLAAREGE